MFMAVFISATITNAADNTGVKIQKLSPYKIALDIKNTKGRKRAIVLYASWCPICVQKMPDIIEIERYSNGSIIAISVEESRHDFARYMNSLEDVPFKAIIIDGPEWKLVKEFEKFGIKVWDSVPHIILMDKNNKVVEQGNLPAGRIAQFLLK